MDDSLIAAAGAATLAQALADAPGRARGPQSLCLNCGFTLDRDARFCSQCGQDTANHPPSLFEFVHEFVSHYIAAEGKLWKSLWGLLARPGFLTLEYLAGRKQRYVLPLRLILTLGLLFFLVVKFAPGPWMQDDRHPVAAAQEAEEHVPESGASAPSAASAASAASVAAASDGQAINIKIADGATLVGMDEDTLQRLPPELRARLVKADEHWRADPKGSLHAMSATMLALAPYAVLCSLPFFAGLLKLLFWRQPYGAHFVFALHLHATWYGILLLATLLPWAMAAFALWFWGNLYPVIALKRVHAAGWGTTLLRAGLLALLHWVVIAIGLTALILAGALATA